MNDDYNQLNVSDWHDIIAISHGLYFIFGFKNNGTVLTIGENENVHCNSDNWRGIGTSDKEQLLEQLKHEEKIFDNSKRNLRKKIYKMSNGQDLQFVAGKPIEDGQLGVYLVLPVGGKVQDLSLMCVENIDDKNIEMWPYKGDDSEVLRQELIDKYFKTKGA